MEKVGQSSYEGLEACFLLGLISGQRLGKTLNTVNSHACGWLQLASREGLGVDRESIRGPESSAGRMIGSLARIRADGRRTTPKAPGFESVVPDCQGLLPDWGALTGPIASSRVSDLSWDTNHTQPEVGAVVVGPVDTFGTAWTSLWRSPLAELQTSYTAETLTPVSFFERSGYC